MRNCESFPRRLAIATLTAAFLASSTAIAAGAEATWRYRATASITIDGQTYTGSSMQEIRAESVDAMGRRRILSRIWGEAPFVTLPNGETVFFLLRRPSGSDSYAERVMKACDTFTDNIDPKLQVVEIVGFRGNCVLSGEDLPMIVSFSNVEDVETIRYIYYGNLDVSLRSQSSFASLRFYLKLLQWHFLKP